MKKTLIAASVGALMLAAAGTASANSLLFPFFTTQAGATSILSLSSNNAAAAAGENLHYVYNYGPSCTHYDGMGKMTNNDLMQHSVAAPAAGGFGKVVAGDKSTPFYFPLNDYGFMTVSTKTTAGAIISGEMAIADTNTGLVASYAGISNNIADTTGAAEGNYSAAAAGVNDLRFNLSFYANNLVPTTSWYGVVTGNMYPAILANRNWTGTASLANGGIAYDNDENQFSGAQAKTVQCAGIVTAKDLMNTAQQASVGANGGLLHVTNTPVAPVAGSIDASTGIVMTKLQVLPGKVVLMHREQANAF